jgi:hypothetical protein
LLRFTPWFCHDACKNWQSFQFAVASEISHNLHFLDIFSDIVEQHKGKLSDCCESDARNWLKQVREKIEKIPNFSEV